MEVYSNSSVTVPDLFEAADGLMTAITWLSPTDSHWKAGIQWQPDCTAALPTIMPCISGAPASVANKAKTWSSLWRGARPFTIFDEFDCTPDEYTWDGGKDRAVRALTNSGPIALEQTVWSGVTNNAPAIIYPNLMSTGPTFDETNRIMLQPQNSFTITGTGGLDVVEALGKLEAAFSLCYPGKAWVHVPAELIGDFFARELAERNSSGQIISPNGNRIIVGKGYSPTIGQDGNANPAGTARIAMTSPMFGVMSSITAFDPVQSLDRSVNTVKFIAERTFIVGWHCCLMAAQVTRGGELAGAVGTPGPGV